MASKLGLNQLKNQIDRLRKDSVEVVLNANKIVYGGVQKLADKELKALNDYYKSAVASIKAARHDNLKGVAAKQLDLLQGTVNQVIAHARQSVGVVAEARDELAKLVQKSGKGVGIPDSNIRRVVAPAKSALAKAKAQAKNAVKQAEKTASAARKAAAQQAKSTTSGVKAKVRKTEAQVRSTVKSEAKAVQARSRKLRDKVLDEANAGVAAAQRVLKPSSTSRAARATSAAKQAVESAGSSVSAAASAVMDAVKGQG